MSCGIRKLTMVKLLILCSLLQYLADIQPLTLQYTFLAFLFSYAFSYLLFAFFKCVISVIVFFA